MKLSFILLLSLYSTMSLAARVPDDKEYKIIADKIAEDKSIKSVIQLIKSGEIDPFVSQPAWHIQSTPGVSGFTVVLINKRFQLGQPIGSLSENLELLKLLLDLGDNPNLGRRSGGYSSYGGNLIHEATLACSLDAIQALEKYGADLTNPEYWTMTIKKFMDTKPESLEEKACADSMVYLQKRATSFNRVNLIELLSSDYDSFSAGDNIQYYPNEIKTFLSDVLKVKLSPTPESDGSATLTIPSLRHTDSESTMLDRIIRHNELVKGWAQKSEIDKKWTCYHSTIDEVYEAKTNFFGWTEKDFNWDRFFLDTFVPYCESLKQ